MTTRTLPAGSMSKSIFIAAPDLLDLVKHHLPGDNGTSACFSIVGGLSFRIAGLAGMVANALAADIRAESGGIDSYNSAMADLDEAQAAQQNFLEAGLDRRDMCKNLSDLLAYKHNWDDYLAQLVGDRYRPTNWVETLTLVAQPRTVDQWSIDDEWNTYLEQLNGAAPEMDKAEFDVLSIAALQGPRAAWTQHTNAVLNVLHAADRGNTIEFMALDTRTQFNLLAKYGSPEQYNKFRINIKKSMMGRSPMEILGRIALYKGFSAACTLATTHHRYAALNETKIAPAEPTKSTQDDLDAQRRATSTRAIEERTKARTVKGLATDVVLANNAEAEALAKGITRGQYLKSELAALSKKESVPKPAPKAKTAKRPYVGPSTADKKAELNLATTPNDL